MILGIVSSKGGVGKTTLAANLGVALADISKKDVLLVDGDLRSGSLSAHFGMTPEKGLQDLLLDEEMSPAEVITPLGGNLWILPSKIFYFGEVNLKNITKIIHKVAHTYWLVIIDVPPAGDYMQMSLMSYCDGLVGITTPDVQGVSGLLWVLYFAKKVKITPLGVIVNRAMGRRYELPAPAIEKELGIRILGVIPEDEDVRRSVGEKAPLLRAYVRTVAGDEIIKTAKHLHQLIEKLKKERHETEAPPRKCPHCGATI
jgi:septum site-determining protein MinD